MAFVEIVPLLGERPTVLRHESLAMALRYAHLTKPDVSAKFRRASPLDNLRAGR